MKKKYLQFFLSGLFLTKTIVFFYQIADNVSWSPHSKNHFAIWEPLLNPIWVPEALNWPQKGLNIELNGMFFQPYSLLGSFLTKTNGFLTRWKIRRVDSHVPTIVLVYEHIGFGTLCVHLCVLNYVSNCVLTLKYALKYFSTKIGTKLCTKICTQIF